MCTQKCSDNPTWIKLDDQEGRLGTSLMAVVKGLSASARDAGLIPGLEDSPGEGKGYPLQYSGLENSMGSQRVGHD